MFLLASCGNFAKYRCARILRRMPSFAGCVDIPPLQVQGNPHQQDYRILGSKLQPPMLRKPHNMDQPIRTDLPDSMFIVPTCNL